LKRGVGGVGVRGRGRRRGKGGVLGGGGRLKENGGLDECLDERFVGERGFWRVDGHTQKRLPIVSQRDSKHTHIKCASLFLSPSQSFTRR